jgi:predicted Zn-dependent protease with MMP-like domain
MVEVTDDRFEELVGDALDSIPDGLGRFMDNVAVFVDTEQSIGLYGLYQGVPLPDRRGYGTPYNGLPMPDRITISALTTTACRSSAGREPVGPLDRTAPRATVPPWRSRRSC